MSKKTHSGAIKAFEPASTRIISPDRFKADLTINDIKRILGTGTVVFPFGPVETLTPSKTVGKGRTNLTIIEPTIVQIDTTPPAPTFANFDKTQSQRNPTIQMHFDPGAYGMTSPATYIMEFMISVVGTSTFNLVGGPVAATNGGTKTVSGNVRLSLVFRGLPAGQVVFGFLEQTSGGLWTWFQTLVTFPPLVLTL